ncbi:hypothetical protein ACFLXF_03740 [Chloroflexota bacterium]
MLYRALWSRIGGRPWTYILRDTWHKFEGLWIIGLVAVWAISLGISSGEWNIFLARRVIQTKIIDVKD